MQPDASSKDALLAVDGPITASTIPVGVAVDDPKGKKRVREDEIGGKGGAGEPSKKRTANDSDGKSSQAEELEKVYEEQEKENDDDGEDDDADNQEEVEEEEDREKSDRAEGEDGDDDDDDGWVEDSREPTFDNWFPGNPLYDEWARAEDEDLARENAHRWRMAIQRHKLQTPSKLCRDCREAIYEDKESEYVNVTKLWDEAKRHPSLWYPSREDDEWCEGLEDFY